MQSNCSEKGGCYRPPAGVVPGSRVKSKSRRVLRLTTILLIVVSLQANAISYAQVSFSGKNVTLETVFTAIRKQAGFHVFYNKDDLRTAGRVTIDVKNATVEAILQEALKGQPFDFLVEGKHVFIRRKTAAGNLDQLVAPMADTGKVNIRARIVDSLGNPMKGAAVRVKNSSEGAVTDEAGYFEMQVPPFGVLLVTYIGYQPQMVRVVDVRKSLAITMTVQQTVLADVTISNGYTRTSRERFVGSVTKIDNELFSRQVTTSILNRFEGIASGLLVDKRTGGPVLQIRGISTLNSNMEPLIILDNFPFNGNISSINPNDVEDVVLLKDAAAASIWGTRAGNGVIVITTKKGGYNQKMRIGLTANTTIDEKPDPYYYSRISSSDFIDLEEALFGKGFYDTDLTDVLNYPVISPVVELLNQVRAGTITREDADKIIRQLKTQDIRDDYNKHVLRAGTRQQYHLNFSGGTEDIKYVMGLGYDKNLHALNGPSRYDRMTINAGITLKPVSFLEISAGINLSQSRQKANNVIYPVNAIGGGKSSVYPYARLIKPDGSYETLPKDFRQGYADTVGRGKLMDWTYRPMQEMDLINNEQKAQFMQVNLGMSANIAPGISIEARYQYAQQDQGTRDLMSLQSYYVRDLINSYTNNKTFVRSIPAGDILDTENRKMSMHNLRGQVNLRRNWSSHQVTALLAAELSESRAGIFRDRMYGYNDDILTASTALDYVTYFPLFRNNGFIQIPSGRSSEEDINRNRSVSFLSSASYTFRGRYSLYGSARKDGANIFGVNTNNKWKPLWSVGVGWDLSKESFYNVKWTNLAKFRLSYGYTGNANNKYPAATTITYAPQNNQYSGRPFAYLSLPPNPNLRWENVAIVNAGFDFGVLGNRITGTLEWYNKSSRDLIAPAAVDPTFGVRAATVMMNVANTRSRGLDISVQSRNLTGAISWNTTLNFSYAKTTVTRYLRTDKFGIPVPGSINPREGQIAWALYGYAWSGLDPATGDPLGRWRGEVSNNYQAIIDDTLSNQVFIGSSLPLYFGNMMNTFQWNNFSLSANISFQLKYYFFRPAIDYTGLLSWVTDNSGDFTRRWQKPGDEQITNVPSLIYSPNQYRDQFYKNAVVNAEKGDHIRLRDVRLAYNLSTIRGTPVKGMQLFLYANNLNILLWKANDAGVDPDFPVGNFPPVRSWTVGLNVNF